jgi:predicted PurR-regulated permease PerM
MKTGRFNWQIWAGFLISIFALLSYPFIFVNWPLTRDFPWANLLLFAVAAVLLFMGVRRAFTPQRRLISKIVAPVIAVLGALILALFIFGTFVASRWLPVSQGAPQVGQNAPDFTLVDTNNKPVSLSDLRTAPINGQPPKGVLLIFYRGYW